MFKESFKLGNFKKTYPLSIATVIAFLLFTYGLNVRGVDMVIAIAEVVFGLALFLYFYTAQNKQIATEMVAEFQEEEPATIVETLKSWKGYAVPGLMVLIVFGLVYEFILPLVGSVAGGLFQVTLLGFEFNILTLAMNLIAVTWLMFGTAQINTIGASFKDTFQYTMNFGFSNFRKVLGFLVVFILGMFIVQMTVVSTAFGNQLIYMPIKVLVMAYVLGFVNTYAVGLFIDNIHDDDFDESENEEEN